MESNGLEKSRKEAWTALDARVTSEHSDTRCITRQPRAWLGTFLLLACLIVVFAATSARAEESAALRLLRHIESLQGQHGNFSPEILPSLIEVGKLYAGGQCDHARELLELALDVSRRSDGLFNTAQLDIYEPMLHCDLALDRPEDLRRDQGYIVMIHDATYGKKDARLVPLLEKAAVNYEEAGLYLSARRLHQRAIDIADKRLGHDDLALVEPLRGMARAFRLEYAYDLAIPDLAEVPNEFSELRSNAAFLDTRNYLDSLGERSLERAVNILRHHPEADLGTRIGAMKELADWYQLEGDNKHARRAYRAVWKELQAAGAESLDVAQGIDTSFFNTTELLQVPPDRGVRMRRTPADFSDDHVPYTTALRYTVTRDGTAKDVVVTESDAPRRYQDDAMRDLRRQRFRPRYVNGEPVDTPDVEYRSTVYVKRTKSNSDSAVAAR